MKMFTAFRAVGLAGLIVALSVSRSLAQDVTVSDLMWLDPEKPAADTLPVFTKKPSPDYPHTLRKEQAGYVTVILSIGEDGKPAILGRWASHPYFKDGYDWHQGSKFSPALKDGKPVGAVAWYAAIFNPKEATAKGGEAVPRLLAATPVMVAKERLQNVPGVDDNHLTVWTKLKVLADGSAQVVAFDHAAHETFRDAIEAALPGWRFAPARRGGQAEAAEISMAFFVAHTPKIATAAMKPDQWPKPSKQVRPEYPQSLLASRQQGEVTLSFTVDETGSVKDAKVVRSNHPDFEEPALEAVYKWKFKPAMAKGKPVKTQMQLPIVFNLHDVRAADGALQVDVFSRSEPEREPEPKT